MSATAKPRKARPSEVAAARRRRRVAKLRDQGLSAAAIAAKVGVSAKLVEWDLRVLRREDRAATPARVVGVDGCEYAGRGGEELAEERALARRAAVDLAAAGWSHADVARLVGVGSSTVGRWLAAAAAEASALRAREDARRRAAATLAALIGVPAAAIAIPQTRAQKNRPHKGVIGASRATVVTGPPGAGGEGGLRCERAGDAEVSVRLSATERLANPDALLTRGDLAELGLERRAVDAVFRSCPVVSLPGYSRPLIRVADYLALLEASTYRGDRVRAT